MLQPSPSQSLFEAIAGGNASHIANCILQQDFTLIEWTEESVGDGSAALMGEVEGFPVILAFSSEDHVQRFVDASPELAEADGNVPIFVVGGDTFLDCVPDGCGVLLNQETPEECELIRPPLMDQIKQANNQAKS